MASARRSTSIACRAAPARASSTSRPAVATARWSACCRCALATTSWSSPPRARSSASTRATYRHRAATRWACASSTSTPTTRSARSLASRPKAPLPPKPRSHVLDLRLIRERPEEVQRALADKGGAQLIPQILAKDVERRRLIKQSEDLKAQRNTASEAIGRARKAGQDASAEQARMREVGDRIKALEREVKAGDGAVEALLE